MHLFYLGIKDDFTPFKREKTRLINQVTIELFIALTICYGLLTLQGVLNEQIEIPVGFTFSWESYLDLMTYAFSIAIILLVMTRDHKSEQMIQTS